MPITYAEIKARRESDPEYAERLRSYARKYVEQNREKEKERQRLDKEKRRIKDRESYNAYMREWTRKNSEAINAKRREKRQSNPEKAKLDNERRRNHNNAKPELRRDNVLRKNYGITLDDYKRMYEHQNGRCAICGDERPSNGSNGLVVDHCHKNGHVRKLLCHLCNKGIGSLRDDVHILANAIDYLNNHRKD